MLYWIKVMEVLLSHMSSIVFIGTFDPLHGAHIGQLLRAHTYKPFSRAYILVNKHPLHKPHASNWEHRLKMAELTLAALDLPFDYSVLAVEDSTAAELKERIVYKISGMDSLIENLSDNKRWKLAQRWPMIVLSIPGMKKVELSTAVHKLPEKVRPTIHYEYVGKAAVPIMNYDFDQQTFISRRIHATYLRSGKDNSLIPGTVRDYILSNRLYE
jgi:nicotinic acid mononucleotide adenylyltransferase